MQVSFAADTLTSVRAQMLEFLGVEGGNVKTPPASVVTTPNTPAAPKTEAPAAAAPAQTTPPTYKEVADLIPKLVAKHGKPTVVTFLAGFGGAKNGKDLKPEQYGEFLQKAAVELPL